MWELFKAEIKKDFVEAIKNPMFYILFPMLLWIIFFGIE